MGTSIGKTLTPQYRGVFDSVRARFFKIVWGAK